MSPEEEFANSYYYFVEALKILAADADSQCDVMGNYNVAWELKHNVSAGLCMLTLPSRELTKQQRDGIAGIVAALDEIPDSVLGGGTNAVVNKRAMHHPCWTPLRTRAAELLTLLGSVTSRNEAFLQYGNVGPDQAQ
ncbi:hypothetical protein KDW63_22865 [Burkholderia cenocepacia]|uniref:Uncharacterized protein n=2 Tax=Burkholderia cenocepacia TaxID=95486 RepID=A0AAW4TD25_9BURK|nr:hypothetical protein [Burkholderia cenocepacia]MBR8297029.1 hypothetical protein [Burkholderia cenocepacia]MCA8379288.1 hypothetical protein [Burkholderia cenocepacia]MDR5661482.1 hypothetical protein [Burkholderia cenocepacia]MDR8094453.1 hypothetical protein [Burkholderia cenocepacia]